MSCNALREGWQILQQKMVIPNKLLLHLERHYQNVIFTMCKLVGLRVEAEMHTSNGRIDMCLSTKDAIYIFEFKLNVPAKEGVRQIKAKDYAAMYAADAHRKVKIGVNFDSEMRSIKDWVIE